MGMNAVDMLSVNEALIYGLIGFIFLYVLKYYMLALRAGGYWKQL